MVIMHFNEFFDLIDDSLPGQKLWMQCVPVWDDDKPSHEGVGLSIQKQIIDGKKTFAPIFFRVVPKHGATDESGAILPERGEDIADWTVETGYQNPHNTLKEAIEETKELARDLPMSPIFRTDERRCAILDQVNDPEDDEKYTTPHPEENQNPPDIAARTGRSQIIKQEMIWPKHDKENSENQETKE